MMVRTLAALKSLGTFDSVLSMGKVISPGWTPFNGLVDEVELFDRALTAQEVTAIYDADSEGICKSGTAAVPSMNQWGPVAMALLLVPAVYLARRKVIKAN